MPYFSHHAFTVQVADTKTTRAPHEHTTNTKVLTITIS